VLRGTPVTATPRWRPYQRYDIIVRNVIQAVSEMQSGESGNSGDVRLLLLVVGLVITAVTYGSASSGGGTYIIAYGPMIVGVIKIIRGLAAMNG
jgi:hypothetical protein